MKAMPRSRALCALGGALFLCFAVPNLLFSQVGTQPLGGAPAKPRTDSVNGLAFNVRESGARGDGVALDSAAINRAIAECNRAGGGTVFFPAGTYLVGTLTILSNVTLHLDAGSVIKGSGNIADYPPLAYSSEDRNTALFAAIGAHDIAITGRGTIDGNADAFANFDQADKQRDCAVSCTRQGAHYNDVAYLPDDGPVTHKERPGILILMLNCQRIQVSGISIVNAPNWCLHAACSRDVVFTGLEIKSSMLLANADGIDGSFCRNVRVSDCNIEAGDDAIAFAACADGYGTLTTENIVVENCTLSSRSNGIRIGWGAHSGRSDFRNLLFNNIVIRNSNRGIGIYVRAGESVENAIFSNIIIETRLFKGRWWGKAEPIHLSAVRADWSKGPMGRIKNIRFSNLMLAGEEGVVVAGCEDSVIEDVTFDGISQNLNDGPLVRSYGGNFDLRPAADERLDVFKHDIPALHADHVRNLAIRHFVVDRGPSLADFVRNGLEIEDFEGLTVDGFDDRQLPPGGNGPGVAISLRSGRKIAITNCAGTLGDRNFVSAKDIEP
ncbi:MAG TPA: glycosyl hydrolase family 28 protein [Opitutaceae bacterium]|nr:glycosyl hydrolase family 28 protein [Opitutaceae bacterium]